LDDRLDETTEEQRKFMHGLPVFIQMSKSQPQLGGITMRQTPEGLRFSINSHSGTATQMVQYYKRTVCDAPFNFHPLYYIFIECGRYANKSLAQILTGTMSPELAGMLANCPPVSDNPTWPAIPMPSSAVTATATATAVSLEEVLERLRAKHTVLVAEYRLISNIEAQFQINQNLTNEIARKRKVLENPECQ
jgi:hypothetical protein